MTKKAKDLKNMTSAQLTDELLFRAYKMTTVETAKKRTALLCAALPEFGSKRPPVCLGEDRCGCMSCQGCRVYEQKMFITTVLPIVKELDNSGSPRALTIIPQGGKVDVGGLPKGDLRGFKNTFAAKFKKAAPDTKAIFWVEASLERRIGQPDHWQWHFHGVVWGLNKQSLAGLRDAFAWSEKGSDEVGCVRPVQRKPVTNYVGWLAYMSKSEFMICEPRIDGNGQQIRTKRPVSIQQEVEFARVLSKFKASQRVFYIGIDRK
jgi:hypothetical protein